MVNYRRNFVPGATYFFTVALEDRRRDTLTKNILALRQAFRTTRSERPFQIDAIVVLPEHLHAIWTLPSSDSDFSGRWRRVKSLFTHHLRRAGESFDPRDGRGFRLWQRRFWEHTIRDLRDYARHVDYVHYNPVHHGYVKIPALWPYSSIHRFIRDGTITADWGATPDQEDGEYGEPQTRSPHGAKRNAGPGGHSTAHIRRRHPPAFRCAPCGLHADQQHSDFGEP